MKSTVNMKKIISLCGAIVAFNIGSGFATGQEIMQFFSSYGVGGCIGACLITTILMVWTCMMLVEDGHKLKLKSANSIWIYYCGKYLGTFLKYFTPFFLFAVLIVMTSGAGSVLNEYYGLPTWVGRLLISLLMAFFVSTGLKNITTVIGGLGVVIIVFCLLVGAVSLAGNFQGLATADEALKSLNVTKSASAWWISGVLYTTFMALNMGPFFTGLGADTKDVKEARLGGLAGGVAFSLCLMLMAFALLASITLTAEKAVPTLAISEKISPILGAVFSVILIAGIFTTTVSLLWISCNFLCQDEKDKKFKIIAVVATVIVFFGSELPFSTLVNIVYPYTGYLGILIFICIVYVHYFKKNKVNPETQESIE